MTPKEIAQWMREEHAVVEELARSLQNRVATIPRTSLKQWIADVSLELDKFQAHLSRHFELEEEGGYLEAVTDRSPGLSNEVERLRHEHNEIGRILRSIHQEMGSVSDEDRILVEDSCCRVQNLLRYIKDHEEREDFIVISAFTSDLGTKD